MLIGGLLIKPKFEPEKNPQRAYYIRFNISFAERERGKRLFFSNKEVQMVLQRRPELLNQPVGYIEYIVYPTTNTVHLTNNYLFHRLSQEVQEALVAKGIASELERRAVRHLCQKLPGFTYAEAHTLISGRPNQVDKRGMKPDQTMPLPEFWQLLQKTTRAWKKRKRSQEPTLLLKKKTRRLPSRRR
jgi:hypothetical protein